MPVQLQHGLPILQPLERTVRLAPLRKVFRFRVEPLPALLLLIKGVFGDLAQPGLDCTVAPKAVNMEKSLIERLRCQLFGLIGALGQPQQKTVDLLCTALINVVKLIHRLPSFRVFVY